MKPYVYLFGVLVCLMFAFLGYCIGEIAARRAVASAIREGRLSLQQRVESVAKQIESGNYRAVGGE